MDRKKLMPIFMIIFTNILGAGMIQPILPLYAEERYLATVTQATLLFSAFFGAQFLAAPWLGKLSDRFGRRPVLMISQAGTVLSFILFIFADPLGEWLEGFNLSIGMTGGLAVFFIARTLDGITGGNITIAQAVVSDISTPETRTRSLGFLSAAFGVGFIVGPGTGGILSGISAQAPFYGALIFTTLTLLLTYFTLDESLPVEKRGPRQKKRIPLNQLITNKSFYFLPVVGFFVSLAFSSIPTTFALYAERILFPELDEARLVARNVGFMMMGAGVIMVLTQMVWIGPLQKRFGDRGLALLGTAVFSLGMFTFPNAKTALTAAVMMLPWTFSRGLIDPTLQSMVTRFATHETRGQMLGIFQSANSMALILGPIWSGAVFQLISPQAVFYIGGGILLAAVLGAVGLQRGEVPGVPITRRRSAVKS